MKGQVEIAESTMDQCPHGLTAQALHDQNAAFAATGGISENNHAAGFAPAYLNAQTGETVISRFADGSPAPIHLLDGLPAHWLECRDAAGVLRTVEGIVSGFLRGGAFYTREQAADLVTAATP